MLPPPPHDALGEDVLWLLDVLGSGYLKNWVIGVDASGCRELVLMQMNCIIQMQKVCINKNNGRGTETCQNEHCTSILIPARVHDGVFSNGYEFCDINYQNAKLLWSF
jgi:hypothetical protein